MKNSCLGWTSNVACIYWEIGARRWEKENSADDEENLLEDLRRAVRKNRNKKYDYKKLKKRRKKNITRL